MPLTIAVVVIVIGLLGRNHAAVVQILGSTFVAITMLLFIVTSVYHMWLGMQVIIEDYVHDEIAKFATLMANTFFSFAVGSRRRCSRSSNCHSDCKRWLETAHSNGGAPKINGRAYPIEDHSYDVVVVGAGGSACARWSAAARPA